MPSETLPTEQAASGREMQVERPEPSDRRSHVRVEVSLPVYAQVRSGETERIGTTLNISRTGVLVRWASLRQPLLRHLIALEIELPGGTRAKVLHLRGRIVRIRACPDGCFHVAIAAEHMDFRARARNPVPAPGSRIIDFGRRRGHSVVEIALLAPWIFFLFVGLVDFGFFAYAMICTQNAARTAALYTSHKVAAADDAKNACQIAIGEMQTLPNMRTLTLCCPVVSASCPLNVTATKLDVGVDGQPASKVQVTYLTVPMIPIPGLLSGQFQFSRTVHARIVPE